MRKEITVTIEWADFNEAKHFNSFEDALLWEQKRRSTERNRRAVIDRKTPIRSWYAGCTKTHKGYGGCLFGVVDYTKILRESELIHRSIFGRGSMSSFDSGAITDLDKVTMRNGFLGVAAR